MSFYAKFMGNRTHPTLVRVSLCCVILTVDEFFNEEEILWQLKAVVPQINIVLRDDQINQAWQSIKKENNLSMSANQEIKDWSNLPKILDQMR